MLSINNYKQKIFLKILLFQAIFFATAIIIFYLDSKVTLFIILNLVFLALVSYILLSNLNGFSNNLKIFHNALENLKEFTFMRTNSIDPIKTNKNDEFALLMQELNLYYKKFADERNQDMKVLGEVNLVLSKAEQGIFKCRVKSESKNFMIQALKNAVNLTQKTLDDNIDQIIEVSGAYASDDYTKKIPKNDKVKEQLLSLLISINRLGDTLNKNAKTNLSNGESLQNNAQILNSSMSNLSSKANEQAASLEQTAASLEEITSLTKNNTENAAKMGLFGSNVKQSVSIGQDLASKTASSMEEINEKVNSINEAITVIDQIAFQTNILSLNAAVEAATAGEAGKGFAVVAQEVRNLASRSAEAAKEIKALVEDANEKANEGKTISDKMIEGYENLNTQISENIHIIEEVTASSSEQMAGIQQINDAVIMLDRVTQENASEANSILNIASEVSTMAHELVVDAQHKKFN